MRRSTHPLAGWLRRLLPGRSRRSEAGDTLIEILVTITVLGGCAVALITTFGTAISASADHRSLVSNATVLRNVEQAAYYQLALQPTPLFTSCATTFTYGTINYGAPAGYTVTMPASPGVQYWDTTKNAFSSTCPAANSPQLITLHVANPNGSTANTQFVVDGPGVAQAPFAVTAVSPLTAIQGSSNLLLTITGTGFVLGDAVTFPTAPLITVTGPTTFVSPTTLNVFVNIAATPALTTGTAYAATVTHLSGASASGGSFTVIPVTPSGMHVGTMVGNIGDPIADDPDEHSGPGWDAWDTITVVNGNGAPLAGAIINGTWSQNPSGSDPGTSTQSCTTDSTGTCTVYYGWRDALHNVTVTFTVSSSTSTNPTIGGLVLNGQTYNPNLNPTPIVISAP